MKHPAPAAASTIFALSSGRPPAAIAVVRVSGPQAGFVLDRIAGARPEPRRAVVAAIRDDGSDEILDHALVLWMPGPGTVTGEDVAELHLHGGRAVVDAVSAVLARTPGLREAAAGEFTRRAFENGRIDLNEAEGLADLLAAETQGQRRAALLAVGGVLSRRITGWQDRLLAVEAAIEAAIDYSEEDDVADDTFDAAMRDAAKVGKEINALLLLPRAERLREGVRVVVAGPPNSGKSSLVNALSGRDAAIVSPTAGTTRDVIEVPIALDGLPILLTDTAGLRAPQDDIEAAGIAKAEAVGKAADIVVWLGDEEALLGEVVIAIHSRADVRSPNPSRLCVSARTGVGLDQLTQAITQRAREILPGEDSVALNLRQHTALAALSDRIRAMLVSCDMLIAAEEARSCRRICDELTGKAAVEDMLDSLFGRFCVGK